MRFVNRVLTVMLGLAALAAGVLMVVESGGALFGKAPLLVAWPAGLHRLQTTTFADPWTRTTLALAGTMAFGLLFAELRPWRKERLLLDRADSVAWWVQRRSLEQFLARQVAAVAPGVDARVRLSPRRGRLDAAIGVSGTPAIEPLVQQAANSALNRLGLDGPRRIAVVIRRPQRVP